MAKFVKQLAHELGVGECEGKLDGHDLFQKQGSPWTTNMEIVDRYAES